MDVYSIAPPLLDVTDNRNARQPNYTSLVNSPKTKKFAWVGLKGWLVLCATVGISYSLGHGAGEYSLADAVAIRLKSLLSHRVLPWETHDAYFHTG